MYINIPENAEKIINTLEEAGFESYVVGGCVRDSVMGRIPNDWDITTIARPEDVKKLFPRTFDTGIKHGTVSVLMDKEIFEVTTYRIDGEYLDGRHPEKVEFTDLISEDLKRRDFTINAMAYNPKRGLVDLFEGISDLEKGVVRCVGNPCDRFNEDALRILRAIRFAGQFGFSIDGETSKAISALAGNLEKISAERIRTELLKLLKSPHPEYIRIAYRLGITKVILPEFDIMMETEQNTPHHCYSVGEHTIKVMCGVNDSDDLRLSALFHDMGKPAARTTDEEGVDHFRHHQEISEEITVCVMKRLKFDNDTIKRVSKLVRYHDWTINYGKSNIRKTINKIGEEVFPEIFDLNYADIMAQSDFEREGKVENLRRLKEEYEEVMAKKECVSLKTLAITGNDLLKMGYKPGPEIGKTLSFLLDKVLEDPSLNTKEKLIKLI